MATINSSEFPDTDYLASSVATDMRRRRIIERDSNPEEALADLATAPVDRHDTHVLKVRTELVSRAAASLGFKLVPIEGGTQ